MYPQLAERTEVRVRLKDDMLQNFLNRLSKDTILTREQLKRSVGALLAAGGRTHHGSYHGSAHGSYHGAAHGGEQGKQEAGAEVAASGRVQEAVHEVFEELSAGLVERVRAYFEGEREEAAREAAVAEERDSAKLEAAKEAAGADLAAQKEELETRAHAALSNALMVQKDEMQAERKIMLEAADAREAAVRAALEASDEQYKELEVAHSKTAGRLNGQTEARAKAEAHVARLQDETHHAKVAQANWSCHA